MTPDKQVYDAVVVGGGPGGLACALWLGRYRHSVCVFDTGDPRNKPAWGVHGFPGIPDPPPLELRARMRQQAKDAGAEHHIATVTAIEGEKDDFAVTIGGTEGEPAREIRARRIVLAYGRRDFVPDIPGVDAFYGHSVYHCPDCDGPSVQGQAVGVYGCDSHAAALALYLLTWSDNVTLLADGADIDLSEDASASLAKYGVTIRPEKIRQLEGDAGCLQRIIFATADSLPMEALFFHLGSEPSCDFAAAIGCDADVGGYIEVDRGQQTSADGVYAVGDISGHPHLAISAAAEGVRAALAIHRSLMADDLFVGNT